MSRCDVFRADRGAAARLYRRARQDNLIHSASRCTENFRMHDIRRVSPRIDDRGPVLGDDRRPREQRARRRSVERRRARRAAVSSAAGSCARCRSSSRCPAIDEVMWARGDVMFDQLVQTKSPSGGPFGLLRRTGYRIAIAARATCACCRDYVYEMHRAMRERDAWLTRELLRPRLTLAVEEAPTAARRSACRRPRRRARPPRRAASLCGRRVASDLQASSASCVRVRAPIVEDEGEVLRGRLGANPRDRRAAPA